MTQEMLRDSLGNGARDLILEREDVGELAVVGLRPDLKAVCGIDQLRRNAHAPAVLTNASFHDPAHVQRPRDLLDVCLAILEGEGGGARGDAQLGRVGEVVQEFFRDAIGEVFLFRVAAHVHKGEHRDGIHPCLGRGLGRVGWRFS